MEVHVVGARIRRGDAACFGGGVPVVDRTVVLDAGVGARPRGLGDVVPEALGVDGLDDLAAGAGTQAELPAFFDGAHELVVDADRVIGVLVLHAGDVDATEVHVIAGIAEDTDLVLFVFLGVDELGDVGVVDVENDHLRRAAGGATGLDGACRGVGSAHEGDRTGCGAARRAEQLLGGADTAQVEAGTGTALEDEAFFSAVSYTHLTLPTI